MVTKNTIAYARSSMAETARSKSSAQSAKSRIACWKPIAAKPNVQKLADGTNKQGQT